MFKIKDNSIECTCDLCYKKAHPPFTLATEKVYPNPSHSDDYTLREAFNVDISVIGWWFEKDIDRLLCRTCWQKHQKPITLIIPKFTLL